MRLMMPLIAGSALLVSCQTPNDIGGIGRPADQSCDTAAARAGVEQTIHAFFAALAKDDHAALQQLTTTTFYAFDVGKKYDAEGLCEAIAKAHQSGRVINWNVGPVSSRVDCAMASAAWENNGSAGRAEKIEPRSWLESAVLVRQGDRWLIDFLHSTPKDPRR